MLYMGIDVIEVIMYILQVVYVYCVEFVMCKFVVLGIDYVMFNVGLIQGGININVVFDLVMF